MKYAKKCPKCGCPEITMVKGNAGAYGSGNNIPVGLTNLSAVLVDRYICTNCGFTEEWIEQDQLEKLRRRYS